MKKLLIYIAIIMFAATTACGAESSSGGVSVSGEENSMDLATPKDLDTKEKAQQIQDKAAEIKQKADDTKEAADSLQNSQADSDRKITKSSGSSSEEESSSSSSSESGNNYGELAGKERELSPGEKVNEAVGETRSDEYGFTISDDNSAGRVFSQRSDLRDYAKDYVGRDFEELKQAIGEPIDFMEADGWGNGGTKSAVAAYDGFMVTCERRGGQNKWKITAVR